MLHKNDDSTCFYRKDSVYYQINRCGSLFATAARKFPARVFRPLSFLYFLIAQAINVRSKCLKTGFMADG